LTNRVSSKGQIRSCNILQGSNDASVQRWIMKWSRRDCSRGLILKLIGEEQGLQFSIAALWRRSNAYFCCVKKSPRSFLS
jgi:hypothetical protein